MSDKVVTLKTKPKMNGRKLVELQKEYLSKVCLDYMELTSKIVQALEFTPNDVAFSCVWGLHYTIADRYILTFEPFSYYLNIHGNPIASNGVGAILAEMSAEDEDDYESWTVVCHKGNYMVIPDEQTLEFIINEIKRGNVDIG